MDFRKKHHDHQRSWLRHQSAQSALGLFRFDRREPRVTDVVIDILYCGVCHSDIHNARNGWGGATYPMVPGHELVGRVRQVGAEVTRFKVGDAVGVGCLVDSCQHCSACARGLEQDCENGFTPTYNGVDPYDGMPTFGGYSERIVVSDRFVVKVPENLDLAGAAPLLCAGITTWSPLRSWKVGPGSKVAVVGLGRHQRVLRANAQERREVPLRHRHGVAAGGLNFYKEYPMNSLAMTAMSLSARG